MKKQYIYVGLAVAAAMWAIWWFGFAPCEFIYKFSYSLRDMPTRCFMIIHPLPMAQ